MAGKVVKVAKAPTSASIPQAFDADGKLAQLCLDYPGYSFDQARRLPYWQVARLLKTAAKRRGEHYLNLTLIAAAPHSKGGDLYKELIDRFTEAANG